jgi:hypothetical protein
VSSSARPRRLALQIVLGGMALAAAVLGWPWLRANLVGPLTLAVWLLLRTLVLSLHQAVWWTALVLAAPALLGLLLARRTRGAYQPEALVRMARPHPVELWRSVIEETASGLRPLPTVGWNRFVQLVVALQSLERRVPPDYRLHDALWSGQVALPPEVHAFLFPPPRARRRGLAAHLRAWLGAPRRAARRLSGRERADRIRSVSNLMSFLERSLEMTRHEEPDGPARR